MGPSCADAPVVVVGDAPAPPDAVEAGCEGDACPISCPVGSMTCEGACIDPMSDEMHCGGCGKPCQPGQTCTAGVCRPMCATDQLICSGACVDGKSDPKNCGICGRMCADTEDCVAGMCKTACRAGLRQPLTDDRGTKWDGLERAADTHANAQMTCAQIGGRLPTATELFRVSATQSAAVGQASNVSFLWAGNPRGPNARMIVRLSDALTDVSDSTTTRRNYRCVCPDETPTSFSGDACHGPPGTSCFAIDARRNMDAQDRAPEPLASALWECLESRGHVADARTYIEAILAQLPNGTFPRWLHTSDDGNYTSNVLIRWQNVQPVWPAAGNLTVGARTDLRPFRCAGWKNAVTAHPRAIPNEFVGARSAWKAEIMDTAAAPWMNANAACFARGGLLPRASELGELVMDGLPNGTGAWLWTADQGGFNGTQFLTTIAHWMGTAPAFAYQYTAGVAPSLSWSYKTEAGRAFRCLYPPIDTGFKEPTDTDCNGGCFKVERSGSPSLSWFDRTDRAPATWENAIATCRARGGHLASERDLTEAIRAGLPNGSAMFLLTSELGFGDGMVAGVRPHVVRWTNVEAGFTDQYPAHMTWVNFAAFPFRCAWTNELR